jgi:hypothetical protein
MNRKVLLVFVGLFILDFGLLTAGAAAQTAGYIQIIQPEDLVKVLQSKGKKPLLLQIGSRVLYAQAHIPGSEYIGAGSTPDGLRQLRKRVESLPRAQPIVLYCGCCPWSHCPNVHPAYEELNSMGFTQVKVLYILNNFGADWVQKGYPVASGE